MTYHSDPAAFAAGEPTSDLHRQWREVSARIDAEDAARGRADGIVSFPASAFTAALTHVDGARAVDAAGRNLRHDGWTPDRQRAFLAALADGETVERACRRVGLTVSSAYALKQRAAGSGFALGWRAANLLARDAVADRLLARALDGQVETVTRPDGSVISRHRYDNRTALALLARLDRMVEQTPADPAAAGHAQAARLVAQDWEAYLDLLEADRGPAAAGLFLARRTGQAGGEPSLEPVLALARADAFVRTGASLPAEVAIADLDPARRADWTAEQWARAEAAGLLRLAAPPAREKAGDEPPHPPLVDDEPVYWSEDHDEYRTGLPAPDGEQPDYESHDYGHPDYERTLVESEQALLDRLDALDAAGQRAADVAARDDWFARLRAEVAAAEAEVDADAGEGEPAPPADG